MPELTQNPAIALRFAIEAHHVRGMLRWDRSGTALLVSDAPRRSGTSAVDFLRGVHCKAHAQSGLLYIDLPDEAYSALLHADFFRLGSPQPEWFEEQALLAGILRRPLDASASVPDHALLRSAMLACAQNERAVRAFCGELRSADAAALRVHAPASSRACAALCALWLWDHKGIGVPAVMPVCLPFCKK